MGIFLTVFSVVDITVRATFSIASAHFSKNVLPADEAKAKVNYF